ncbi:4-alpha-glucanotransferase [Thiomonas sp.]|uniref:4-alpha-glucanotransferase n=1 Tax=Thiomonas sp. TaxID=2047785 RepID=UPI00263478CB|nr:4-alpha-glucanotransferase [Thiomonas sp.]
MSPSSPAPFRLPRSSGVLLHLTSLPGPHGSGDLGADAYHFVDWLQAAGQSLWQFLPLGGIGLGHSPYMSTSAFAGNVLLIDLAELHRRGWLDADDLLPEPGLSDGVVDFDRVIPFRLQRLQRAAQRFATQASAAERAELQAFCAGQAAWLDDYALFMALSEHAGGAPWMHWPAPLAQRQPQALAQAREQHAQRIAFWTFAQWCFFRQWAALRAYAHSRNVRLVGDMPIFLSLDSADVWARPDLFQLDADGQPTVVAGVPPDYFSATGQRWGNPLYRWQAHADEGFAWWIARLRATLALVDVVRIDHFRGFDSCWEIPAHHTTAIHGRWAPSPGQALFDAVTAALGPLPIIAEDLGIITPDVTALRQRYGFPGMRVLQFAWGQDDGGSNVYLPHHHTADSVVYTGTHDNDTTVGWWHGAPEPVRDHLRRYLACDGGDIAWTLMRAASASVAGLAIHPMQDVLRLDGSHRLNTPGTTTGNWRWRFSWEQVHPGHAAGLLEFGRLYDRLPR